MKKIIRHCYLLRVYSLLFDEKHLDLEFLMPSGNIICAFVDICWDGYFREGSIYEVEFAYKPRLFYHDKASGLNYYRSELSFFPLARVGGQNVN